MSELFDVFYTGTDNGAYVENKAIVPNASVGALATKFGANFYSKTDKFIMTRITGVEYGNAKIKEIKCRFTCPDPGNGATEEENERFWSQEVSWGDAGIP